MTRLLIHPLYYFALMLALCVSVGVAGLLLSHSHFFSAPEAAEISTAVVSRSLPCSRARALPEACPSKESV